MKVSLTVPPFSGNVYVIKGVSCSRLPTTHYTSSNLDNSSLFYALPGSTIDISISEDLVRYEHGLLHIWITPDVESFENLNIQTGNGKYSYDCANHQEADSDTLKCFPVDHETTIHYNVTKPGYYHFLLTNRTDTSGILKNDSLVQWHYNYTICDLESIREKYSISNYSIPDNGQQDAHGKEVDSTQVQIPHGFADFHTDYCALLELVCDTDCLPAYVKVTESQYRKDMIILIFIIYILATVVISFVLALSILVACTRQIKH